MLSESRHRQVKSKAPRILLISKESIATRGLKAGIQAESGLEWHQSGPTHSRFAAGLATRIDSPRLGLPTAENRPRTGTFPMISDVIDPDPGPHGFGAPAGQAARRYRRATDDCPRHAPRRRSGRRARRGGDRFRRNRRCGHGSGWACRDDAERPCDRLGPHLRGAGDSRPGRPRENRRQRAGRFSDASGRRHPGGARPARRPCGRHRDAGAGDHRGRRAHRPECRQGGVLAGRAGPPARALFHPRDRALGRRTRSTIISVSTPIAVQRLRASSSCRRRRWRAANGWSNSARSKPACASTWR